MEESGVVSKGIECMDSVCVKDMKEADVIIQMCVDIWMKLTFTTHKLCTDKVCN